MKIDAHQHFWIYNPEEYAWISEQMSILRRDFLPQDLKNDLYNIKFDGSITIQARQCLPETEWLLKLADAYDFIKGVVGWIDLRNPQLDQQLKKYTTHEKFVGVRHVVHDEADDQFLLRSDFLDGIRQLIDFNLTYDILIFERHLPVTIEFVQKFPEHKFVLDHIAKPRIGEKILQPWKKNIQRLAEFPNLYCKVSGMVTEADWVNWKNEDFTPYLDVIFESFGTARTMIGSDWPVCMVAGSYQNVMQIVLDYVNQFPKTEKKGILGLNALKFYNIK